MHGQSHACQSRDFPYWATHSSFLFHTNTRWGNEQTCHEATNQPEKNMFRRYGFPLSATIERCLSKAAAMAFRRPPSLMPNGRSAADSEACLGTIFFFKYPGILATSRTACIPVLARTFYDWMPTMACHGEVHASKARTGHMLLLCFAWRTRYLHLPTSTTILR
jgi:hypothetical protein